MTTIEQAKAYHREKTILRLYCACLTGMLTRNNFALWTPEEKDRLTSEAYLVALSAYELIKPDGED